MSDKYDNAAQALRFLDTVMHSKDEDMRKGAYNRVSLHIQQQQADLDAANAKIEEWVQRCYEADEHLHAANARADEAEACIKSLMLSMRLWGAEEDGIPDDPTTGAWAAYSRAKCLLCPEREAYRCTEYDLKSCAICEPCAACGKIRKHSFASFFVEDADGHFTVTCNDTCARNAASAREAVRHE